MIPIDVSHAFFRTFHMNQEAVLVNNKYIAHLLIGQFLGFAKKLGASKQNIPVLCVDSKPTWRYDYYEQHKHQFPEYDGMTYKGNRVKDPTIPWDNLNEIINDVLDSLQKYSDFYVVKVDMTEADDVIAVLSKTFKKDEEIWIASSDKDFVQLQDDRVKIYDPLKKEFKPELDVKLFKIIHNIIGDTSDNILAIKPRTKEATAVKMLKDLNVLLETNPSMKAKYEFNRNLIDLDCIPTHLSEAIIEEYKKQSFNYNVTGLMKMMMKYDLREHAENIQNFKLTDALIKTTLNQKYIEANKNAEISRGSLEEFFE